MSFVEQIFNKFDHAVPGADIHVANVALYKKLGQRAHDLGLGIEGKVPHQELPAAEWQGMVRDFLAEVGEAYFRQWRRQFREEPPAVARRAVFECAVKRWLLKEWRSQRDGHRNYAFRMGQASSSGDDYERELDQAATDLQEKAHERCMGLTEDASSQPAESPQSTTVPKSSPKSRGGVEVGIAVSYEKDGFEDLDRIAKGMTHKAHIKYRGNRYCFDTPWKWREADPEGFTRHLSKLRAKAKAKGWYDQIPAKYYKSYLP
ncbi:MAG: hypothetical protein V3T83_11655 [Acidobacteriota bacterium]